MSALNIGLISLSARQTGQMLVCSKQQVGRQFAGLSAELDRKRAGKDIYGSNKKCNINPLKWG